MVLTAGPLPKYHQLADIIRRQIASGELKPNDQLPNEEALCRLHGVSRGTVREAIRTLVEAGLLRREQGRGTFINPLQTHPPLFSLTSFAEDMRHGGRVPSTQLITAEVVPAPREVAVRLELASGEPVIHIVRLRLADGQPVVYEIRYLAEALCPNLLDENLETASIHSLLIDKYQIPMVRLSHVVEVGHLSPDQAQLLGTSVGQPAFFVERLTYTLKNQVKVPAVWFRGIYREDTFDLRARFQAPL
jgi:GntR family transcriptional regulator